MNRYTYSHNAALAVAGVTWGFRGREELVQAGADYIVEDPAELERIVRGA